MADPSVRMSATFAAMALTALTLAGLPPSPLFFSELFIILGGIQTDLSARVLRAAGAQLTGLYAVGEAAGFGGGGMHGKRSLEGTFLGGCVFTGRIAARAIATEPARAGAPTPAAS